MTTQKQIEANYQNAQLSTGPISESGKVMWQLMPSNMAFLQRI